MPNAGQINFLKVIFKQNKRPMTDGEIPFIRGLILTTVCPTVAIVVYGNSGPEMSIKHVNFSG
jgi:hypothetical protein